jgi:hypothetical protein
MYASQIYSNPLKPEIHVNNVCKYGSYLTEDTQRLHYKDQSIGVV